MIRYGERATTAAHGGSPLHPPVSPMLAAPADALPTGPGWAYEPKWDGWRALAFDQPGRVYLQSRTGRALSAYFPEVTRIIAAALPAGTVLDGELLIWDPDRDRTSFPLLQRRVSGTAVVRLTASRPAQYVVFDLLRDGDGHDLTGLPRVERRARLTRLPDGAPGRLMLCPQTTEPALAQDWMAPGRPWASKVSSPNASTPRTSQGDADGGRSNSGSVEVIIGGVTGALDQPHILLIGRFDTNGGADIAQFKANS